MERKDSNLILNEFVNGLGISARTDTNALLNALYNGEASLNVNVTNMEDSYVYIPSRSSQTSFVSKGSNIVSFISDKIAADMDNKSSDFSVDLRTSTNLKELMMYSDNAKYIKVDSPSLEYVQIQSLSKIYSESDFVMTFENLENVKVFIVNAIITNDIDLSQCSSLELFRNSINAPHSVADVGKVIFPKVCNTLTELFFQVNSGTAKQVTAIEGFEDIELSEHNSLKTIEMYGNTAITKADFKGSNGTMAAGLGDYIIFQDCANLSEAYLSDDYAKCKDIEFIGCALTEAMVDSILVKIDEQNLTISGYVDLSGGTNAAPSATGLAARTNLIGRGYTVNVNS